MTFKSFVIDSLQFTKDAFAGNGIHSGILLVVGLCLGLFYSVNPLWPKVYPGGMSWPYPWWILVISAAIWFILDAIISGYCVRIFRSGAVPSFSHPAALVKDGVAIQIAIFLWALPSIICAGIIMVRHVAELFWPMVALTIVPFVAAPFLFLTYAKTGKLIESIRFSIIRSALHAIGMKTYLMALGIAVGCFLLWALICSVPVALISHVLPGHTGSLINALLVVVADLFFVVFVSRFFTYVFLNRGMKDLVDTMEILHETG